MVFSAGRLDSARVLVPRVRARQVRQQGATAIIVCHRAEDTRRPVLRLGQSLSEREHVLRQPDRLQHYLLVFTCVRQMLTLALFREELLDERLDDGQAEDLVAVRPVTWRSLQHELDNGRHLLTEMLRDARILSLDHLLVEALHVVSAERRN